MSSGRIARVILVLCLPAMISILACGPLFTNRTFSVSRWKTASKDERGLMADDFLRKIDTMGMTVNEVKRLLGNPDHEQDSWSYNLSVLPPQLQNMSAFLVRPRLYVQFKDDKVESLSVTEDFELSNELTFKPSLWKESPPDRLRMTASLMTSETLKGLSKEEVEQLIGHADGKDENHEIEYELGYRMIDLVTLTFTLDAAGEVTAAKVIEH